MRSLPGDFTEQCRNGLGISLAGHLYAEKDLCGKESISPLQHGTFLLLLCLLIVVDISTWCWRSTGSGFFSVQLVSSKSFRGAAVFTFSLCFEYIIEDKNSKLFLGLLDWRDH